MSMFAKTATQRSDIYILPSNIYKKVHQNTRLSRAKGCVVIFLNGKAYVKAFKPKFLPDNLQKINNTII